MKLRADNSALAEGRTVFPFRVIPIASTKKVLYPASGNKKIGNGHMLVAKGKWRGMPCYTLTLEERSTCPPACEQWAKCYGNNMRFARRIDHRDNAALYSAIERDLKELATMYRKVLVRPHVLGDFFSEEYVEFWMRLLREHPGLHLFGFTHWKRDTPIGQAVQRLNDVDPARSWFRFSDSGGEMSANVEGEGIPCPEQLGKTASCMTCGLCWTTRRAISFKEH